MAIRAPCGAENKVLALKLVIRGNLHHYEKARKSRQMQFRDKTAYVWGLGSLQSMRSFAIEELGSRTSCHPG